MPSETASPALAPPMSCHCSSPVPAHALDDDDLLEEILLRLSPQPSSLPRVSLVCKSWRRMLSDPRFLTRFRKHHNKPPLLGFFVADFGINPIFTPVLGLPHQIPATRFSVPQSHNPHHRKQWRFTDCRHGLVTLINDYQRQVIVWDPLSGHHRRMPFPPALRCNGRGGGWLCHAAVLCADAEDGHVHGDCYFSPFNLVLITGGRSKTFACLYESASGLWGNIASTTTDDVIISIRPSILIGNALHWLFDGGDIIVFDMESQTLGVIEKPTRSTSWSFQLLRTHGGTSLGYAVLSELSLQVWERGKTYVGAVGWVLQPGIIKLEEVFPLIIPTDDKWVYFVGYDDDTNLIVLSTRMGKFMLQLESMQIRKISETNEISCMVYYPYTNFYTAGREVGWKWLDLKL